MDTPETTTEPQVATFIDMTVTLSVSNHNDGPITIYWQGVPLKQPVRGETASSSGGLQS